MEAAMALVFELWSFLRERKKWWLAPVILVMLLVGTLLIFAQGSVLAPFIYTVF
jgi:drug/metabolite transporter superfamily protein YnfA